MSKRIESILELFIKSEITATDDRIAAIRTFVNTLKGELLSYTWNIPTEPSEKEYFLRILKLFRSMISTYDEEIRLLIVKRERLQEHLLSILTTVSCLFPQSDNISTHIN